MHEAFVKTNWLVLPAIQLCSKNASDGAPQAPNDAALQAYLLSCFLFTQLLLSLCFPFSVHPLALSVSSDFLIVIWPCRVIFILNVKGKEALLSAYTHPVRAGRLLDQSNPVRFVMVKLKADYMAKSHSLVGAGAEVEV